MLSPLLTVNRISKTFEQLHTLDDVSLTIAQGEFVSIVGPSGCGKSTLLEIISGLTMPDRGELIWRDKNTQKNRVAFMPQRDVLFPWRTVLDNLTVSLEIKGIKRNQARKQASAYLQTFGLSGFEHYYPQQLSGGMRQRASFLRAYLSEGDLLCLDEPFGQLDAITRQELHLWLLDVWQRDQKTVILITHDIDEAIFLSDRIFVMSPRPGRLIAEYPSPFKRPHTLDAMVSTEYLILKNHLLKQLLQTKIERVE